MSKTEQLSKLQINEHGVGVESANHIRFSDLIWYDPSYLNMITIGGAGGIGSWVALALSRAGYKLSIWDDDTVDETNLGGQLYGRQSLGQTKSSAVQTICTQLGADQRIFASGRFTEANIVSTDVVISAFDNMKARKTLFNSWKQRKAGLFIDGRMLAEAGQVYYVKACAEDIDAYELTLFEDTEVKDQPCSAKATTHCGMRIASEIMSGLTNWIGNSMLKADIREVPFYLEFQLPLLNTETKTVKQCITHLSKP